MNENTHDVIICTRNRFDAIERLLENILSTSSPSDLRVIVVENSEHDKNFVRLEELKATGKFAAFHDLVVIRSSPGLPTARNTALKYLKGQLVTFLDDDVKVPPNFFNNLHEKFRSDKNIAGITPIVLAPTMRTPRLFILKRILVKLPIIRNLYFLRMLLPNHVSQNTLVEWMPGCCMSFRHSSIIGREFNVGLEKGPTNGYALGEDYDFTHRMYRDNFKLIQIHENVVIHELSPLNREQIETMEKAIGRWIAYQDKYFNRPFMKHLDHFFLKIESLFGRISNIFFNSNKGELTKLRLKTFLEETRNPTLSVINVGISGVENNETC